MPNNLKALLCNGLRMLVCSFHEVGFLVWPTQTTFSRPAFKAPAVGSGVLDNVFVVAGPVLEMTKREVAIPAQCDQIGWVQFTLRRNMHRYQVVGFEVPIRAAGETIGAFKRSIPQSAPTGSPGSAEDHSHGASEQAVNHAAPARLSAPVWWARALVLALQLVSSPAQRTAAPVRLPRVMWGMVAPPRQTRRLQSSVPHARIPAVPPTCHADFYRHPLPVVAAIPDSLPSACRREPHAFIPVASATVGHPPRLC